MPRKQPRVRAAQSRPQRDRPNLNELYPAIVKWVRTYGWIEIGDQESVGFVARALDWGGMVFEDTKLKTFAEAMSSLERGIAEHLEHER